MSGTATTGARLARGPADALGMLPTTEVARCHGETCYHPLCEPETSDRHLCSARPVGNNLPNATTLRTQAQLVTITAPRSHHVSGLCTCPGRTLTRHSGTAGLEPARGRGEVRGSVEGGCRRFLRTRRQ